MHRAGKVNGKYLWKFVSYFGICAMIDITKENDRRKAEEDDEL